MALNQDVDGPVKHMMAFITQEACEKVEEIDTKVLNIAFDISQAEEEFQIEKSRLIHEQKMKIMHRYAQKEKKIELSKKIQASNMKNEARLQILRSREEHLKMLREEAREKLVKLSNDRENYKKCLSGLFTQCLFQLMEPEVVVKCRAVDRPLLESIAPECLSNYEKATGLKCRFTISPTSLSPDSAGGVDVSNVNGRIAVSNTLESRLDQIGEQLLPQLRALLFGRNANRKFND